MVSDGACGPRGLIQAHCYNVKVLFYSLPSNLCVCWFELRLILAMEHAALVLPVAFTMCEVLCTQPAPTGYQKLFFQAYRTGDQWYQDAGNKPRMPERATFSKHSSQVFRYKTFPFLSNTRVAKERSQLPLNSGLSSSHTLLTKCSLMDPVV